jgi:hypothetical protein
VLGVFYGATTSEGNAFAGEYVVVAGGAGSVGQAAVNLARYAQQVTIVVRGKSLAARMSQYLIDEITATANIDVRTRTQTVPASALVVLVGAVPHTDWLQPQIGRDEHGFVLTGSDLPPAGTPRPAGPCRARRSRWRSAFPACSLPATSATARSSASPPHSAKVSSPPPSKPIRADSKGEFLTHTRYSSNRRMAPASNGLRPSGRTVTPYLARLSTYEQPSRNPAQIDFFGAARTASRQTEPAVQIGGSARGY